MPLPQLILFALGVLLIVFGIGMLAYGSVQSRAKAGAGELSLGAWAKLVDAVAGLGKVFIDLISVVDRTRAAGAGMVSVVVGLALIVASFFLQTPT